MASIYHEVIILETGNFPKDCIKQEIEIIKNYIGENKHRRPPICCGRQVKYENNDGLHLSCQRYHNVPESVFGSLCEDCQKEVIEKISLL